MSKANEVTVQLLDSLQKRVSNVSDRVRQTADELADYKDFTNTQFERLEEETRSELDELEKKVDVQGQALRDNATGTTNALHALKGSTQLAFDQVREDVSVVNTALTKFNSRISALEGASKVDVENIVSLRTSLFQALMRLSKLEQVKPTLNTASVSTLEIELKELLTRYGYDVTSVSVSKSVYKSIANVLSTINSLQAYGNGTENIEVKLGGSKAL